MSKNDRAVVLCGSSNSGDSWARINHDTAIRKNEIDYVCDLSWLVGEFALKVKRFDYGAAKNVSLLIRDLLDSFSVKADFELGEIAKEEQDESDSDSY